MEKERLLISACLLGIPCRYDGKSVPAVEAETLSEKFELVPFCPEIYGGLPTPRIPSERIGDKVMMRDGRNVTSEYRRGAENALKLCRMLGIKKALLKCKSPSCGKGKIYDGTFTGSLTDRDGVTAELLMQNGVEVYGENEPEKLLF